MKRQAILTCDIGTSSLKTCLWDWDGTVVETRQAAYEVRFGPNGEAEQNPEQWLDAVLRTTSDLMERREGAYQVEAIGLTGQMSGCVLAGPDGRARMPAMTWQDRRSHDVIRPLATECPEPQFFAVTGQRFDAGLPFAKLLWVRQHRPELLHGATLFDAQTWLACRLTGSRATDISNASGSGMMDIRAREWSADLCRTLRIPQEVLPDILPSHAIVGLLLPQIASRMRLPAGLPVVIGMGDGPSSCLGLGITQFGQAYGQIGTSAWISAYSDQPPADLSSGLLYYAYADGYVPTGSMQAAGQSLAWFREIAGETAAVPYPDAKLPYHFPYMFGERTPYWFSEPRGAFLNLASHHGKADLHTSVFEGVVFHLRTIRDRFRDLALTDPDRPLLLSGGMLGAEPVASMMATMLEEDILVAADPVSSTSLGAYYCARAGIERRNPLSLAKPAASRVVKRREAGDVVAARYRSYRRFAELIQSGID